MIKLFYKTDLKALLALMIFGFLALNVDGQITFSYQEPSCVGESDGSITVQVNNGNPPYQYSKDGGGFQGSNFFDGVEAGSYEITVKDSKDCEGSETATLEDPEGEFNLLIAGGGKRTICDGDPVEVNLTASADCPDCTLTWSTGETGGAITVTSGGTYSVTASKDGADCDEKKSTTVEIDQDDCDDDDDTDDDDDIDIPIPHAVDPNDIIGPIGVGPERWVSINDVLDYTIRYENDPKYATAPAQKVIITHALDPKVNIYSFRLSSFGFGSFVFNVPPNSTYHYERLDVIDSLGVYVDFTAGFDVVTHEAFWILESIDPLTGLPPADALIGFLPVNDTAVNRFNDTIPKRGEGFVSFSVRPKDTDVTRDTIFADASIVFDINAPIVTPTIFNTVDAFPPMSMVDPLDAVSGTTIDLNWTGFDDTGGCGLDFYDLYVSEDGGPFTVHQTGIMDTTYQFVGVDGVAYSFFTRATDYVGNQEPLKNGPDATTIAQDRIQLFLKALLEGSYVGSGMMSTTLNSNLLIPENQPFGGYPWNYSGMEIVTDFPPNVTDWILVTTRADESNTTSVDTVAALLTNDGNIIDIDGTTLKMAMTNPVDSFYVSIYHRNHVGVMSSNKIGRNTTGVFSYDFTGDYSNTFGGLTGIKDLGGGYYGMISGDYNGNGQVQNSDYNSILPMIGLPGYLPGDLDINGEVQNVDIQDFLRPNIGRGALFQY